MESFAAALNAHADAVYIGARDYNMRVSADAVTETQIPEIISKAHDAGVKVFLAVNTLVYTNELSDIARLLDTAADTGIDAVILWDTGVLEMARERGLQIHLSTQASVSNISAVRFYASLDVKRIVLARELSLGMIADIVKESKAAGLDMQFECFVHGALCVAVSGRCLTSQFLYGRSANRGDCLQPCRRTYKITDVQDGEELILDGHTVMSARDLCTIDILDRIIGTGINALKIEGRMRDARYVRTTVECYREARDAVLSEAYDSDMTAKLKQRLSDVFHRGFSHGFYTGQPDLDIAGNEGNTSGIVRTFAGRIENYYRKVNAADIQLVACGLTVGDVVSITGPTTGEVEFAVSSIRSADNKDIQSAGRGELISIATQKRVRIGDRVFLLKQRDRND